MLLASGADSARMAHRSRHSHAPPAAAAASSSSDSSSPTDGELDYEAQRQRQIARNQSLLTQLTGVEGLSTALTREQAAAAAETRATAAQIAKQARAQARAERAERLALLPRRDLPARRGRGELNYAEDAIAAQRARNSTAPATDAALASTEESDAPPRENASLSDFVVADNYPIARTSSGTSSKHVRTLPLARLAAYLGLSIPLLYHTPKASAMSFLVAGWPSESNPRSRKAPPTFNKMSGIQKLANHVAVFINVDPPAEGAAASSSSSKFANYSNQWSEQGRVLTWFAQPTQRVGTPVIGTMLAAARAKLKDLRSGGNARKEDEEYAAAVLGDAAAAAAPPEKKGMKRRKGRRQDDEGASLPIKSEPTDTPPAAAAAVSSSAATSSAAASSPSASAVTADDAAEEDAADDGSFDPPSLLLFLRHVGGPYVYAGQLAYRSHDTTRTPMKFEFELAEFDRLLLQGDFRKLLPDEGRAAMMQREKQAAAETSVEADTTKKQNKKARK